MTVAAVRNDRVVEHRTVQGEERVLEHQPLTIAGGNDVFLLVHQRHLALLELVLGGGHLLQHVVHDVVDLLRILARNVLVEREHHLSVNRRHGAFQILRVFVGRILRKQSLLGFLILLHWFLPVSLSHAEARYQCKGYSYQLFHAISIFLFYCYFLVVTVLFPVHLIYI